MSVIYEVETNHSEVHEHTHEGYVILARGTYRNSKTWKNLNPIQKVVMITLIMMANHKSNDWWDGTKFITVKRGQLITSLNKLVEACGKGVSIKNVRTALEKLEKMGFLANESAKQYRLITLVNYDLYQTPENYLAKQSAKDRQTTGKGPAINNNDNNVKNEKKREYAQFVTMTIDEYNKLVTKYGEQTTKQCIETLNNYKGASGKKYKSDYHAILKWVVKEVQKSHTANKLKLLEEM